MAGLLTERSTGIHNAARIKLKLFMSICRF